MDVSLEKLRRYIKRCDPDAALSASDDRYVAFDDAPTVRGDTACIDLLERTIRLSEDERSCQLFTGFPGTGKTTELRRLERMLAESRDVPTVTVYVDFEEYVDRYTPIAITDVLRVLAYRMDAAAAEAEKKDPSGDDGYLARFFRYVSRTDVELEKVGFAAYGANLIFEIKNNPTFRQRVEAALAGRFQQFAKEARDTIQEAVVRLRRARGVAAGRVVVIADGLEKLTPLREEDRTAMELSVETLFLTHREFLHLPACHTIYTFPLWLRFRSANLGASFSREPLVLPTVKVQSPHDGSFAPGIDKMIDVIAKRVDLREIFGADPRAILVPLVEVSGGYTRDLLRLVRTLLSEVRSFPVTREQADRVVHELAQSYANTVLGTYLDVLARVAVTNELPKDDAKQLAMFGYLLEHWLILAYRNGDEWYDVHPLVRRVASVQARIAALKAP